MNNNINYPPPPSSQRGGVGQQHPPPSSQQQWSQIEDQYGRQQHHHTQTQAMTMTQHNPQQQHHDHYNVDPSRSYYPPPPSSQSQQHFPMTMHTNGGGGGYYGNNNNNAGYNNNNNNYSQPCYPDRPLSNGYGNNNAMTMNPNNNHTNNNNGNNNNNNNHHNPNQKQKRAAKRRARHDLPGPAGMWFRHQKQKKKTAQQRKKRMIQRNNNAIVDANNDSGNNNAAATTSVLQGEKKNEQNKSQQASTAPDQCNNNDNNNNNITSSSSSIKNNNDTNDNNESANNDNKKQTPHTNQLTELLFHDHSSDLHECNAWNLMCTTLDRIVPSSNIIPLYNPSSSSTNNNSASSLSLATIYKTILRTQLPSNYATIHEIHEGKYDTNHVGSPNLHVHDLHIPLLVGYVASIQCHAHSDWTAVLVDEMHGVAVGADAATGGGVCGSRGGGENTGGSNNNNSNVSNTINHTINNGNYANGGVLCWIEERLVKEHPNWIRPGVVWMLEGAKLALFSGGGDGNDDIGGEYDYESEQQHHQQQQQQPATGNDTSSTLHSNNKSIERMILVGESTMVYAWTPEEANVNVTAACSNLLYAGFTNEEYIELMERRNNLVFARPNEEEERVVELEEDENEVAEQDDAECESSSKKANSNNPRQNINVGCNTNNINNKSNNPLAETTDDVFDNDDDDILEMLDANNNTSNEDKTVQSNIAKNSHNMQASAAAAAAAAKQTNLQKTLMKDTSTVEHQSALEGDSSAGTTTQCPKDAMIAPEPAGPTAPRMVTPNEQLGRNDAVIAAVGNPYTMKTNGNQSTAGKKCSNISSRGQQQQQPLASAAGGPPSSHITTKQINEPHFVDTALQQAKVMDAVARSKQKDQSTDQSSGAQAGDSLIDLLQFTVKKASAPPSNGNEAQPVVATTNKGTSSKPNPYTTNNNTKHGSGDEKSQGTKCLNEDSSSSTKSKPPTVNARSNMAKEDDLLGLLQFAAKKTPPTTARKDSPTAIKRNEKLQIEQVGNDINEQGTSSSNKMPLQSNDSFDDMLDEDDDFVANVTTRAKPAANNPDGNPVDKTATTTSSKAAANTTISYLTPKHKPNTTSPIQMKVDTGDSFDDMLDEDEDAFMLGTKTTTIANHTIHKPENYNFLGRNSVTHQSITSTKTKSNIMPILTPNNNVAPSKIGASIFDSLDGDDLDMLDEDD